MKDKKVIIFDLDGTIAPSKSAIDAEMAGLLERLVEQKYVAIISGGPWKQFEKQLLSNLNISREKLSNLVLCPTSASRMYRFEAGEPKEIYAEDLTTEEKKEIMDAFDYALPKAGFEKPSVMYGELIEDRGSQISFSANGQDAPLEIKSKWDPDQAKRRYIIQCLTERIADFEVRIGGTNTIDITRKGVDKAYGVRKISEQLNIPISEMVYVGDALYPGGNDEKAKDSGIECVSVDGPADTKKFILSLLN